MRTVGNGARLMPRFQNLPEVVFGKHHRVLLFGRMKDLISDLQQISPERQMGAMLFQNPERQKASGLGLFDCRPELGSGQFFPIRGILALMRPVTLVTMTCRWWQDMIQCQAFP